MERFDFQLLNEADQLDATYRQGVYLGKRKIDCTTVVLYQVRHFYVEIYYKKYRLYVTRIRCFESTEMLSPYLEQINVYDLINC